jgi:dTDP-L-rhamnose 4-epimerase
MGEELPIFEDGEETRDFVHVADVAQALVVAATTDRLCHSLFNVGSGLRTTVAEVAALLCDVLGYARNLRVTGQYRLGDIRHNFADISRLKELGGTSIRVGLEEGLSRFAEWVLTQALPLDGLERANEELRARKLMGQRGSSVK